MGPMVAFPQTAFDLGLLIFQSLLKISGTLDLSRHQQLAIDQKSWAAFH